MRRLKNAILVGQGICVRGCIRYLAKEDGSFAIYRKRRCDLMKKRTEYFLWIYAKIRKERPEIFKRPEVKSATSQSPTELVSKGQKNKSS
jgi:hypothetical protein